MSEYFWETSKGTLFIRHCSAGWRLWLDDDCFDGPFPTAQSALDQLAGGHTASVGVGDPSTLDFPDDLSAWLSRTSAR